jgi:hypothetical protein
MFSASGALQNVMSSFLKCLKINTIEKIFAVIQNCAAIPSKEINLTSEFYEYDIIKCK